MYQKALGFIRQMLSYQPIYAVSLSTIILLALGSITSAQTIPSTDADLDSLKAALIAARKSAKPCNTGSCPQLSCKDAVALGKALDDARVATDVLQQSLNKYFELLIKRQLELNKEYGRNASRDETVRLAFVISKALSTGGKLLLDIVAVVETVEQLNEFPELLENGASFETQISAVSRSLAGVIGSGTIVAENLSIIEKIQRSPEQEGAF